MTYTSARPGLLCLDPVRAEQVRSDLDAAPISQCAGTARQLGDPTRLAVAAALAFGGEVCVGDVTWIVGRSHKLVSHHLRALREAGLATSRRQGKIVFYRLQSDGDFLVRALMSRAGRNPA